MRAALALRSGEAQHESRGAHANEDFPRPHRCGLDEVYTRAMGRQPRFEGNRTC